MTETSCSNKFVVSIVLLLGGGVEHKATFTVSPSGYMDDELGPERIQQHFEPYTRVAIRRVAEGVTEGVGGLELR